MTASTRLTEVLTPLVAEAGYDLEELRVSAAGKRSVVRLVVDKDGGVTLDDVAALSRVVSDALDAEDEADPSLLGTSYVLEVTSPGVDRPLTQPRHWRRNVGRLVKVVLREGGAVEGRISGADEQTVTLEVAGAPRVLPCTDVAKGLVQVEFSRAADDEHDAGPDDGLDDGADEGEGEDA